MAALAAQEAAVATLQKRVAVVEQALADAALPANAAPALPTVAPGPVVVSAPVGTCCEDVCKLLRSAATEAGMILIVGGAKPWKNQPRPQEALFFDVDVPLGGPPFAANHPPHDQGLADGEQGVCLRRLDGCGPQAEEEPSGHVQQVEAGGPRAGVAGAEVWVKSSEPGKKRVQYVGPWVEQGSGGMDHE